MHSLRAGGIYAAAPARVTTPASLEIRPTITHRSHRQTTHPSRQRPVAFRVYIYRQVLPILDSSTPLKGQPDSANTEPKSTLSKFTKVLLICLVPIILQAIFFRQPLNATKRLFSAPAILRPVSTMSSATRTSNSGLKIVPRYSQDRGNADHGWLKTFHTFSFAMYQDDKYDRFGSLRVINEDRVTPGEGFGTHAHREFEIFSYSE